MYYAKVLHVSSSSGAPIHPPSLWALIPRPPPLATYSVPWLEKCIKLPL